MTIKNKAGLTVIINDSTIVAHRHIIAYKKGNFNPLSLTQPIANILWYNGRKILVLDSAGIYSTEKRNNSHIYKVVYDTVS